MKYTSIYNRPLYYISFKISPQLEKDFESVGFKNINFFKALNGKSLSIQDMVKNNLISMRAYNDLVDGREQDAGLSGKGSVGCYLSHLALWKKCVENNWDYIIIAEDDVHINRKFTDKDIKKIEDTVLNKPNGAYFTANIRTTKGGNKFMYGLHLYFISKGACEKLIKKAFPIEAQIDSYITYMNNIREINIDGNTELAKQKWHQSSVQNICVKCILTETNIVILGILGLAGIILLIFGWIKYVKCYKSKKCLP